MRFFNRQKLVSVFKILYQSGSGCFKVALHVLASHTHSLHHTPLGLILGTRKIDLFLYPTHPNTPTLSTFTDVSLSSLARCSNGTHSRVGETQQGQNNKSDLLYQEILLAEDHRGYQDLQKTPFCGFFKILVRLQL